ncbi:MAG TPA: GNAT family protein [Phenylobacterium sp.]|jgi:RimJ/RimL family protein N-acetyltransferase|nr:GNAT family protein [Phenylobacterium sp.]
MTEDLKPWFPIRTERLLLRDVGEEDFADVHAYAEQPQVARLMDWGPNTPEQTRVRMDLWLEDQKRWPRDEVSLAIEHVADRQVIGSVRLAVSDRANLTGDIGYSLHSAYWRQGYATEAARAVVDAGFRALGLRRIWAECDVRNVGSWGVMQKLGMRREAHHHSDKLVKGAWRDSYLYAILADEWI